MNYNVWTKLEMQGKAIYFASVRYDHFPGPNVAKA